MAWNNQGGGNGGGWKGGGPWGQGPTGGGSGGGGGNGGGGSNQPDLEDILRRSQDRLKQAMPGGGLSSGLTIALALAALALVGFFGFTTRVNADQKGIVTRFGKFDRVLDPGINFRWPSPIEDVYLPPVTQLNQTSVGVALPGAARGSGSDSQEEGFMLTGDENIVDIGFVVKWQIRDPVKFIFNVKDGIEFLSDREAATVRDVAESAMRDIVGRADIQRILTQDRRKTETAVQELMQRILDSYDSGISVSEVLLQEVQPPADVVEAFRDVQAARIDMERIQNEAQSYANKIVPEARGEAQKIEQDAQAYKEQVVAESIGQSERFLKVYEQYKLAPEVTRQRMYLESMERVYSNAEKIIIDQSGGGSGVVPYLPLNELTKKPAGVQ